MLLTSRLKVDNERKLRMRGINTIVYNYMNEPIGINKEVNYIIYR
jgi:hypothetical protein